MNISGKIDALNFEFKVCRILIIIFQLFELFAHIFGPVFTEMSGLFGLWYVCAVQHPFQSKITRVHLILHQVLQF